jgi:superfamily II DNA/RNA helicase
MHPTYPSNVLTLSRKVDECKPLIIGAAETGSGKTLAFGLPILQRLLTQADAAGPVRHLDWEEHVIPYV